METDTVETPQIPDAEPLDLDLGSDAANPEGGDPPIPEGDDATPLPDPTQATPPQQTPAPIKDKDVVQWLREQAKTAPDQNHLYKTLQDNYFRAQEFTKLFPEIEQARTIKTHLDAIGGLDGLNELQSISNDMSELYSQIDSGDPGVIDDIAENSREGFVKLVPHALDTLYRIDPQSYNNLLTPIIANTLLTSPIVDSVALAMERLQRGETDAAMRELTRISQTFESLKANIQRGGNSNVNAPGYGGGHQAAPAPTPQAQPSPIVAQIQPVIEQFVDRTIRTDIGNALGGRQLSQPAMDRVVKLIGSEIDRTLGADANYQSRIAALFRSGNAERTRQFIQANVDQVRPRVVRQIMTEMYGGQPAAGGQRRAAPPRPQGGGAQARPGTPVGDGVVNLARPPRNEDIDWSKTNTTAMIAHRAVLKDGRNVRWPFK